MRKGNKGTRNEFRHVRLYHWMMLTKAWQSLNANQRAIYIEIASRYGGTGSNNGTIPYSVREAAKSLRIGRSTASRDLKVLENRGFIVTTTKGAFSRKNKHASEWRLTEFPCDVTHDWASKDFTRWAPEIQNTVPPQNVTVPVAEPIGTCSGADAAKMSRNGAWGGTQKPRSAVGQYPQRDTFSLPGVQRRTVGSR
jgi:DNA-binding transcriptional regulator YhcF (GntR family)